ncbi:hypothetical protein HmCmsJML099_04811 [Escherichia coli]|nr:hypothetical protein HmCmsJML099_04811 [Escherichia coli]
MILYFYQNFSDFQQRKSLVHARNHLESVLLKHHFLKS